MTDGHSVHSSNQAGMGIAAWSSSFVQKNNVQNIWGAQSTYNNTNIASISLGTAFSTEQNATTSWGTPSAVGIERSIIPCNNVTQNLSDIEMDSISHTSIDVLPSDVIMDDNNNEHNRKRKETMDTETKNTTGNLTVSQQRRNELSRSTRRVYDLPNATWRPVPVRTNSYNNFVRWQEHTVMHHTSEKLFVPSHNQLSNLIANCVDQIDIPFF